MLTAPFSDTLVVPLLSIKEPLPVHSLGGVIDSELVDELNVEDWLDEEA